MTTSVVLGLAGCLLVLVGLIGGGFSFSGSMMPVVGNAVRIPCFIVGGILVVSAIVLALREYPSPNMDNGGVVHDTAGVPSTPTTFAGTVYVSADRVAYVYQIPSLAASKVGALTNGTHVTILCTAQGDTVIRADGMSSSLWDRIDQGYMPDVNVDTGTDQPTVPNCSG